MTRVLMLTTAAIALAASPTMAAVQATFDFETGWAGDYAPGWENSAYRWGTPPVGKMMQQTTTAHGGSYGMQLIADSVPKSSMWWAGVYIKDRNPEAMKKENNPYFSVWYYDEDAASVNRSGQMYAVPSWVNLYLTGAKSAPEGEDWTDIQFGARYAADDDYYYVAVGENHPGWQDTGVARAEGWVQLTMQLESDGYVRFYIGDFLGGTATLVGTSYRNDYIDLGTENGLYTMFQDPLSDWGDNKPYTIWDDVTIGSDYDGPLFIPEPASLAIWGLLGTLGLAAAWRRRGSAA